MNESSQKPTEAVSSAPKKAEREHRERDWDIDNLPNRLALFRMFLIPVIIGCLSLNFAHFDWIAGHHTTLGWIAAWTFAVASITDFFDGYIARKRGIVTVFGSFLDPIADKFLVVSSLLMLQALGRIQVIVVIILVLREFYITSLRLLAQQRELSIPVSNLGKWKTATMMVGVPFLMANDRPYKIPLPELGIGLIYIASIISLYSAVEYSMGLFAKIKKERHRKKEKVEHASS